MEELKRTCRVLGDVPGIRLMNSIEIIDPDTGTPSPVLAAIISQHTLANRLLVSHCPSGTVGGHNIRLPLTVTQGQIDPCLTVLADRLRVATERGQYLASADAQT
jgi:4-aminobutyrate aminotransferase-like enzyme